MTDVEVGVITAGAALGGVLVTQMFNLFLEQRRENAAYRVGLYAKRLEIHQEAFRWLMDLIEPAAIAQKSPGGSSDHLAGVAKMYVEARKWWDSNCLYLDENSRESVIDFIELVHDLAEGSVPPLRELTGKYRSALRAVQEGIGMKHLDVKAPKRSVAE
jgi:hypothetical protein